MTKPYPWLWVAGRDMVGHARLSAASTRTVCGEVAILIRYAWPFALRCEACTRGVEDAAANR